MTETKQEKYELVITANEVISTDARFTMDNLGLGDNYKPLDSFFKKSEGEIIRRNYNKGERRNSNQTMPRLACQVFERSIVALSVEEKENFPVCQYTPATEIIRGIFTSVEEFRKHRKSLEYLIYSYDNDRKFVFYCWNVFSTIIFIQECLKRFGREGDEFVLTYRKKDIKEAVQPDQEKLIEEAQVMESKGYNNPYSSNLIESKNIIFRGAPGTGKTYLAKEIATDIVSNGYFSDYMLLSEEQKKQIEFVQFHPSYDYTDFVEGLRPKTNDDGSMGFELQDGVFKRFVTRAKTNFDNSQKSQEVIEKETSVQEMMSEYFSNIELGVDELETVTRTKFHITGIDDKHINISIPENKTSDKLSININELKEMLASGQTFTQVKDVRDFFGKLSNTQQYSYDLAIFKAIKANKTSTSEFVFKPEKLKPYIFIIDEINRGEISKILGELFFSIDPGYRGRAGEVSTQYANLYDNSSEKFYIPENVYIIGTMNDIDRSVDSFDFAMRRRFRFIEIKADERLEMLDYLDESKEDAIQRMTALNNEISKVEELNENYHIGASYFLKLKILSVEQLWTDYLSPLLLDYVRGMYDEEGIMKKFAKAYGYVEPQTGDVDDGDY
ncbi:MAG: ATPase [Acetobacterium sp. MES1]|uniref:McrB family protein n=1 Tax=Acetobacterium sp. MES1 TaxID=1899015 RepID=UPI000B9D2E86|nr:AAA family ATPase [Acetobacterium sp. MES1]OXS26945.1 MAG: ATPase [Acetobacterium sp. MES1]